MSAGSRAEDERDKLPTGIQHRIQQRRCHGCQRLADDDLPIDQADHLTDLDHPQAGDCPVLRDEQRPGAGDPCRRRHRNHVVIERMAGIVNRERRQCLDRFGGRHDGDAQPVAARVVLLPRRPVPRRPCRAECTTSVAPVCSMARSRSSGDGEPVPASTTSAPACSSSSTIPSPAVTATTQRSNGSAWRPSIWLAK